MNDKLNVFCLTATCGRHFLLERLVGFFIAQDYDGEHTLLIFNNSSIEQSLKLPILPSNKHIELLNQHIDSRTGKPYDNLGAIYNDILLHVPNYAELITHSDDDDSFLPNHISEGVKGFQRGVHLGFDKAYKPEQSWFKHAGGIDLMGNNLEPSVFIDATFLRSKGYSLTTTDQHLQWFRPLLEDGMFVDPLGIPTLVYDWHSPVPTFKTSGNAGNPSNFTNYRISSIDHGDKVISPSPQKDIESYYKQVYDKSDSMCNKSIP